MKCLFIFMFLISVSLAQAENIHPTSDINPGNGGPGGVVTPGNGGPSGVVVPNNGRPGGGKFKRSTENEVKEAIDQSAVDYRWLIREINAQLQPDNAVKLRNPRLRKIFTQIALLPEFMSQLPGNHQYEPYFEIKPDFTGPCYFEGQPNDSSVSRDESGHAIICMSVKQLQRYPKQALRVQVAALVIHELSHLAGAKEPVARYIVQPFAIKLLESSCLMDIMIKPDATQTQRRITFVFNQSNVNLRCETNSDSERLIHFDEQFSPFPSGAIEISSYIPAERTKVQFSKNRTRIVFAYRNSDGSFSQGSVAFGKLTFTKNGPYTDIGTTGPIKLHYVWKGKRVEADSANFSEICFQ